MLTIREEYIATITASMVCDVTADEALRYRAFPGHHPDHEAYGWTEIFASCARFAEAFVSALSAKHGTFDAFWVAYHGGVEYRNPGVFDYDVASTLLEVIADAGGDVECYDAVAAEAVLRFAV